MAKVTSKLQVTIPKRLADAYAIAPGDDIEFVEAGEGIRTHDDVHSDVEPRYQRLATSVLGRVLLVVYTVRRTRGGYEEKRIISARQASRKERAAYSRP